MNNIRTDELAERLARRRREARGTIIAFVAFAVCGFSSDLLVSDPLGENLARAILSAGGIYVAIALWRWRRVR